MSVDPMSVTAVQGLDPTRARIAGAIKQASDSTGASFGYLVAAAKIESNLQPTAAASTSSARGLYQFIEQTWLGTVKQAGTSFGYGQYADAITKQPSGNYTVSDPALRQQILKLRDDPAANAAMAGVLTQSNSFKLVSAIAYAGGTPAPAAPAQAALAFASTAPDRSYLVSAPQPSSSQLFDASPTVPSTTTVPAAQQVASVNNDQPMFRSLFQVGDRAE